MLLLLSCAIWVSDAQFCKYGGFQRLHLLGLRVGIDMIMARKVEQSVDDQMRGMGFEGDALVRRLARAGFSRERDVAEHDRRAFGRKAFQFLALQHREAEHVGGLVALAPFAVQAVDFGVRGEQQADDEARVGEQRLTLARSLRGALRERVPFAFGPILDVDIQLHRAPLARVAAGGKDSGCKAGCGNASVTVFTRGFPVTWGEFMHRRILVIAAAVSAAFAAPVLAQTIPPEAMPATAEEEAAALAWLGATGVPFDPSAYDEATLAPLAERLGSARVIGIGEATHGSHQDQAFKAELIRQLVRAGKLDVLILEANRIPGMGFDRYIREGKGDLAEVVQAPAFFRIWKNDEFGGLLLWLRNWNRTAERKVRIIGVDCQDGGRDAAAALALVERHDAATAARLRADLGALIAAMDNPRARFVDWMVDAPLDRLTAAHTASEQLAAWFETAPDAARADPAFSEARWAARTAYQAFLSFEFERADADKSKADPAYFARRDRFMGENAIAMLAEGERGALWAHDMHVLPELPPEAEAVNFVTTGSVLRKALGTDYAAVGFTWSTGGFRATRLGTGEEWLRVSQRQTMEVFRLPNNRPGDLGHLFDRTGHKAMWVDLGKLPAEGPLASWAKRPYWRGWAGGAANPEAWQTVNLEVGEFAPPVDVGFDVMVWFQTISGSHIWPVPPAPPAAPAPAP